MNIFTERPVKFYEMVFGKTFNSHKTFIKNLLQHHLQEVSSVEDSDVIIAFVVIVSRAGTDIDAALQRISQKNRPVVLVVLHHTFDPYFIAPESRRCVNRSDVFTVDCLFHEDRGFLQCHRNDEALRSVSDYLISKRASDKTPATAQSSEDVLEQQEHTGDEAQPDTCPAVRRLVRFLTQNKWKVGVSLLVLASFFLYKKKKSALVIFFTYQVQEWVNKRECKNNSSSK